MPPRNPPDASDHDLLIRIDTKVDLLNSTLNETRTALSARIDRLATEKASVGEVDTLRKFIEKVQADGNSKDAAQDKEIAFAKKMIYMAIGAIWVVQALWTYWITHPR